MVASTVGPTGAILLAHKRSFGSPLGRQNSHPRRIRRELTWTRGTTNELGGCMDSRKFSEERWRRGRERTAPPAAESMLANEGTDNQEVRQFKSSRSEGDGLLRTTRITGDDTL